MVTRGLATIFHDFSVLYWEAPEMSFPVWQAATVRLFHTPFKWSHLRDSFLAFTSGAVSWLDLKYKERAPAQVQATLGRAGLWVGRLAAIRASALTAYARCHTDAARVLTYGLKTELYSYYRTVFAPVLKSILKKKLLDIRKPLCWSWKYIQYRLYTYGSNNKKVG